jgi:hypothetical protein
MCQQTLSNGEKYFKNELKLWILFIFWLKKNVMCNWRLSLYLWGPWIWQLHNKMENTNLIRVELSNDQYIVLLEWIWH